MILNNSDAPRLGLPFFQMACAPELVLLIFKFTDPLSNSVFNCLDTDLKQIACVSPPSIILSSRLNNFKRKLFALFLKFA